MTCPRVSIGLPVYNGERYLREAIESILSQTFSDFELIISDNASTDATSQICQEYASRDPRIRYSRNVVNVGAAANYNRAFALSQGEYFKWAAHDDVCAPEFLARCVAVLDQNPSVVICYPRTIVINEHGAAIDTPEEEGFHLIATQPSARFLDCLKATWVFHPVFGLIRRQALAATPLIANYVGSDLVLLASLALAGQIYEHPDPLFFRREHPQRSGKLPIKKFAQWWNPKNAAPVYLPQWRRIAEYGRAIAQARLPWREQQRCYTGVLRWVYWRRYHLLRELTSAFPVPALRVSKSSS